MKAKLKTCILGVVLWVFLFTIYSHAADFDIIVVSSGETSTITIRNSANFPAYVYDLVKADGTSIGIHIDVIDTVTMQISRDLSGIVKARRLAASNAPSEWDAYRYNPNSQDGLLISFRGSATERTGEALPP